MPVPVVMPVIIVLSIVFFELLSQHNNYRIAVLSISIVMLLYCIFHNTMIGLLKNTIMLLVYRCACSIVFFHHNAIVRNTAVHFDSFDFSTLHTNVPHDLLLHSIEQLGILAHRGYILNR